MSALNTGMTKLSVNAECQPIRASWKRTEAARADLPVSITRWILQKEALQLPHLAARCLYLGSPKQRSLPVAGRDGNYRKDSANEKCCQIAHWSAFHQLARLPRLQKISTLYSLHEAG
jgi:hypothetical protein